jgi:hypothetical protein
MKSTVILFIITTSLLIVQSQASDTNYGGRATHVIKLRSAMNSNSGKCVKKDQCYKNSNQPVYLLLL